MEFSFITFLSGSRGVEVVNFSTPHLSPLSGPFRTINQLDNNHLPRVGASFPQYFHHLAIELKSAFTAKKDRVMSSSVSEECSGSIYTEEYLC